MTFAGLYLFGTVALVCEGPTPIVRAMDESLPGVNGFRRFALGVDRYVFAVSGRLVASTASDLATLLKRGADYEAGMRPWQFVTTLGAVFNDCFLTGWRQTTPIRRTGTGYTCRVSAVVVWASPTL